MSTHIQTACPNCQRLLNVRREYVGKRVSCKHCGVAFEVLLPGTVEPTAPVAPQTVILPPLDDEVLSLRQEIDAARVELDRRRAENESLRSQLAERDQQSEEQQTVRDRLRDELKALRGARAENESLQSQLAEREQQLNEQETVRDRLHDELETLRGTLAESRDQTSVLSQIEQQRDEALALSDRHKADLERLRDEFSAHGGQTERLAQLEKQSDEARASSDRVHAELEALRSEQESALLEVERLKADLDKSDRSLADATAEVEAARDRWEDEQQGRQAEWDQQRGDLADEAERRLVAERERLAAEHRDMIEQVESARQQAEQAYRQELERLGNEIGSLHDQVATLERERDEAARRAEIAGEHDRLSAAEHGWQERFEASHREFDQERAAHREDMAQLGEEFDSLRSARDAAVHIAEELTRDRDRLAALNDEATSARNEAEQALQAELARLAEDREQLLRQAEAERSRGDALAEQIQALHAELDQLRGDRASEQKAHEQTLGTLRTERDEARQAAEAARQPAPPAPAMTPSVPADAEQRLAEVQSQLQQAETSRSMLIDALKSARNQIEELSIDLAEVRQEQFRVRSILDGMGIHLI